ncbi:hypothetical protein AA106555_2038 [Neokomagataea thailandica NBRC 106555]|uniref:DUF2849 domain-containing protein n=2 Tax=Neokomagataea TaxID=1223423 RepID=A0A4Y6V360_9PROT|nr:MULTISPECIES: DUF2849 domain-containing protein [Neokomagataea]QDH24479.1 DUF2849 domain-containing protein [Neokomagataea tanensis]GBR55516.1 hypothetical protein AA106555_2038 [Neokomagataea thailandica NBRC 106555]
MKRALRVGAGEGVVITANRLLDGAIVWLAADDIWLTRMQRANVFEPEAAVERVSALQSRAQSDGVVGIYEIAVRPEETGPMPVTMRERIRAFGPTVHPQFAYTAQEGVGA